MSKFIESILKIIERAQKNLFFWLVIAICCLPLGFIFDSKYFSISGSFVIVLITVIIIKIINNIRNNRKKYNEELKGLYNLFKSLLSDERCLLIELFLSKTAQRKQKDFYINGSYGLRSHTFYELIDCFNLNKGQKIIQRSIEERDGEYYNCFSLDEDFRLYYYKYFKKLYKQNKNIVNK